MTAATAPVMPPVGDMDPTPCARCGHIRFCHRDDALEACDAPGGICPDWQAPSDNVVALRAVLAACPRQVTDPAGLALWLDECDVRAPSASASVPDQQRVAESVLRAGHSFVYRAIKTASPAAYAALVAALCGAPRKRASQ